MDGTQMTVISHDGASLRTMPCPVPPRDRHRLRGARRASISPPPPAGPVTVQRQVSQRGQIMVVTQRIHVGMIHARKIVTVIADDRSFLLDIDGLRWSDEAGIGRQGGCTFELYRLWLRTKAWIRSRRLWTVLSWPRRAGVVSITGCPSAIHGGSSSWQSPSHVFPGSPSWQVTRRPGLDRFPPPAVVVVTDDLFAVSRQTGRAMI
jgi:hypothetical protein